MTTLLSALCTKKLVTFQTNDRLESSETHGNVLQCTEDRPLKQKRDFEKSSYGRFQEQAGPSRAIRQDNISLKGLY